MKDFFKFEKKEMALLLLLFGGLCLSFAWVKDPTRSTISTFTIIGDSLSEAKTGKAPQAFRLDKQVKTRKDHTLEKRTVPKIELNRADSAQLEALPMIGPTLSQRILRYRNRLGGFYSIDQLKEVYGLRDSCFEVIKTRVWVDTTLLERIDIQNCSLEVLGHHPYFGYKNAKIIIRYRQEHRIQDWNTVRMIKGLALTKIEMSRIYLRFDKI